MKKVPKKVTVTKYVSDDGIEFDSEIECMEHEKSEIGELLRKLSPKIINQFVDNSWCPSGVFAAKPKRYVIYPDTRTDIFNIKRILELASSDMDEKPYVPCDRLLLLTVTTSCGIVTDASVKDIQEYVETLTNGRYTIASVIKDDQKKEVTK